MSWSADGNLLASNTGRLVKLGSDGKDQTQLLADPSALIVSPSSCGTKYLVLSWEFHGGTNSQSIWRTNEDGSRPLKLTDGKSDFYPVCSSDQKWVYYSHWIDGQIYRVLLAKLSQLPFKSRELQRRRLHCLSWGPRVHRACWTLAITRGACNSFPTENPLPMPSERTPWTTCGCSRSTVQLGIKSQISSRSKSGLSASRPMERASLFCAGTTIPTLFSCENPNRDIA